MKRLALHWPAFVLGACALATLAILVWPVGAAGPSAPPAAERYLGPDHQARRSGPVPGFALRLQAAGVEQAAPVVEALPVLVGLTDRRAYLRSAQSGEVEGVAVGQTLDGWRLVSVSRRSATVRGPAGDRRLGLFAATTPTPEVDPPDESGG